MRPDFALNLSFDGITLLQRVKGGWAELGAASLDGDLALDMATLKDRADAAGADKGIVKLILPDDQIKILTRDMPQGAALDAAARDAIDGQTPYSVDELRIDALAEGGQLHVAAVARETLQEAEAFALEYGFTPVGFVAAHGNGFGREVCFGEAESWSGKPLKPDTGPLKIVPMPEPEAEPEPEPEPAAEPEPEQSSEPARAPAEDAAPAPRDDESAEATEPEERTEAAPEPPESPEPEEETAPEDDSAPAEPEAPPFPVRARAPDPLAAPKAAPAAPTPVEGEETPAFVSMRARRDAPPAPKMPAAPLRAPGAAPGSAPRLSVRPVAADRIDAPVSPDPDLIDSLTRPDTTTPEPEDTADRAPGPFAQGTDDNAAMSEAAPTSAPVGGAVDAPALAASTLGAAGLRPGTTPRPDSPQPKPAPETRGGLGARLGFGRKSAPTAPATPAAPPPKKVSGLVKTGRGAPTAAKDPKSEAESEAERMTVFGARRKDNYVGGKPRFLGLMLTSALLLFLLGVAAWASVFLEDGLARFFRSAPPTEIARVPDDPLPQVTVPEAARPAPSPEPQAEPVEEASLTPDPLPEPAAPAPDPLPPVAAPTPPTPAPAPAPAELTPEEAEATYAATGIWQRAPEAPADIRESDAGDVYVASIDPDVPQFDATALPMARVTRDPGFEAPPIPAPAGTVFDLDERGLVRATPEGAVNPDRVRIFAGQPPAVPPLRGDALAPVVEAIPERDDGTRPAPTEIFQRLQGVDDFRPTARPEDLQEQNDRANLTGLSRPELAALRPALRPDVEKAEQERDITATAQAVAVSERPSPRPVNMARIVASAQAQQAAAPPAAQQVAAVAPRTVAPSIPSNTSVARAATEPNALNLRRINLIGIYGQPSNRSALVRLSNGRYVKVSVGDRLDGGRVAAIGESQLRYVKGGRNVTLEMPRG